MRKIVFTIVFGLGILAASAQIQKLAGPRLGLVYISDSPGSSFLNGDIQLDEMGELPENYNDIAKGALTSLYGWQWESRFAEGGDITGIVEWIALVGGMEKGKFLPSVSSMFGVRSSSGIEFAVGPNLSLSGIAMVFGMGYNFKSGNLNIPINIAFVPGKNLSQSIEADINHNWRNPVTGLYEDKVISEAYTVDYNSGNRVSITVGFNLSK